MGPAGSATRTRFLRNDRYRAEREWLRLEGTAQRDLFRELRSRFLHRHVGPGTWALDAGSGPGRFTAAVGAPEARRIAADLGQEALQELERRWPSGTTLPYRVRADLERPPFAPGSFGTVAALGNLLGFAGDASDRVLAELAGLVAPSGTLVLEVAPGAGEASRYLGRLPATAVARLLRSPVALVARRAAGEGFRPLAPRKRSEGDFHRLSAVHLQGRLRGMGFTVTETLAVAPGLGTERARIEAIARDPVAWQHLLEVEEVLGGAPDRWPMAAAVLVAAEKKSEA